MTTVYRLLRKPFAANPFDGEGSYRFGGRWSRPGTRLVYTAEHLSLAMIEYLVHIDPDHPPKDLVLARAVVPDDISRTQSRVEDLPHDWRGYPAPAALAEIGSNFVEAAQSAVLLVPSALAVTENNWLLNPAHPEFKRIKILSIEDFHYDPRLLRS
ncbi:MAG TPA: RES family NAD+ phosphorylase [Alloacidobacterium sp.]|nr:RES family NAD+ phosphorylase [Alloacidobacterium sp.]